MRRFILMTLALICGCGSQSTEYWIAKLKAPDASDRLHGIHALKERADQANVVVPALMEVLKDSDTFVRRDAAAALGEFGPDAKSAVPALLALQNDKEPVRRAAADALEKIDPEAAAKFKKPTGKKSGITHLGRSPL
jgi:HEAT repeat protein